MFSNNITPKNSRDRGQVLILTTITIAVILLGAVVVVNTGQFTERQQADGATEFSERAEITNDAVVRNLEASIRHANFNNDSYPTEADKETVVQNDIDTLDTTLNSQSGYEYGSVSITHVKFDNGTRITQQSWADLTDERDNEDWTVVQDSGKVRSFTILFNNSDLPYDTNPFIVDINNGDARYEIYRTGPNTLALSDGSETYSTTITDDKPVAIGFSGQKLGNRTVPILPNSNEIEQIEFENGDSVTAKMDLVAGGDNPQTTFNDNANVDCSDFNNPNAGPPECQGTDENINIETTMQVYPAVYSATVNVTINTPHASTTTELTIKPRESYLVR